MKIFIICSKQFYSKIPDIKNILEQNGHIVQLPNCYDDPSTEYKMKSLGENSIENLKLKCIKKVKKLLKI